MTKYIYKGDFAVIKIAKVDYIFIEGKDYTLPENDLKVQQFVKQKKLIKIETEEKTAINKKKAEGK